MPPCLGKYDVESCTSPSRGILDKRQRIKLPFVCPCSLVGEGKNEFTRQSVPAGRGPADSGSGAPYTCSAEIASEFVWSSFTCKSKANGAIRKLSSSVICCKNSLVE